MRVIIIIATTVLFGLLGPAIGYLFSGYFPSGLSDSFVTSLMISAVVAAVISGVICGVLYGRAYTWSFQPNTIAIALYCALCGFILTGLMLVLLQQGFYRTYSSLIFGLAVLGGFCGFVCSLTFAFSRSVVLRVTAGRL